MRFRVSRALLSPQNYGTTQNLLIYTRDLTRDKKVALRMCEQKLHKKTAGLYGINHEHAL